MLGKTDSNATYFIIAALRRVLGLAISASMNAPIEPQRYGVFRM